MRSEWIRGGGEVKRVRLDSRSCRLKGAHKKFVSYVVLPVRFKGLIYQTRASRPGGHSTTLLTFMRQNPS